MERPCDLGGIRQWLWQPRTQDQRCTYRHFPFGGPRSLSSGGQGKCLQRPLCPGEVPLGTNSLRHSKGENWKKWLSAAGETAKSPSRLTGRRHSAGPRPSPNPGKGSALLWLSLSNRSRGARSASFTSKCLGGPNCQGYCHPSLAGGSYPTMRSFGEGVKLTRQCKKCIMQHRTR